jgi:hypothetical protein
MGFRQKREATDVAEELLKGLDDGSVLVEPGLRLRSGIKPILGYLYIWWWDKQREIRQFGQKSLPILLASLAAFQILFDVFHSHVPNLPALLHLGSLVPKIASAAILLGAVFTIVIQRREVIASRRKFEVARILTSRIAEDLARSVFDERGRLFARALQGLVVGFEHLKNKVRMRAYILYPSQDGTRLFLLDQYPVGVYPSSMSVDARVGLFEMGTRGEPGGILYVPSTGFVHGVLIRNHLGYRYTEFIKNAVMTVPDEVWTRRALADKRSLLCISIPLRTDANRERSLRSAVLCIEASVQNAFDLADGELASMVGDLLAAAFSRQHSANEFL